MTDGAAAYPTAPADPYALGLRAPAPSMRSDGGGAVEGSVRPAGVAGCGARTAAGGTDERTDGDGSGPASVTGRCGEVAGTAARGGVQLAEALEVG